MLTFALVSARGKGSLSADLQRRLEHVVRDGTLDAQLVFPVADRHIWFNADRSIAVVVWSSGFDPFGAGPGWIATEHGFTAFSGHVWPRGQGWDKQRPWALQLAEFCDRSEFPSEVARLSGTFTALHVQTRGRGHVFADPFSIGNVYMADRPEYAVFASRAAIAAWIGAPDGQEPRRDALGIGWMGFAGVILDDVTGFEGVTVLPQCARVDLDGAGEHKIATALHPARWYPNGLRPEEAALVARADLDAELRAISELGVATVLSDLTGGKDSRVILAGMLSAGVVDSFRFLTRGPPDLPDVHIANHLAEQLGLQRARPLPLPEDEAARWRVRAVDADLGIDRRFVFGTSGMCTLWSSGALPVPLREVTLNGVGGEPWYTNYPASGKLARLDQFPNWLYNSQKIGKAGLVKPEARAHYETVIARIAQELLEGARTPQDAVDKYYLRVRMRRWWGTYSELDRQNRVHPLFSAPAIAAAFALGSKWRHAQYLPYSLMLHADTRLVTTPFADDVWPEALGELVGTKYLTPDMLASRERPVSGTGSVKTVDGRPAGPKRNASTHRVVSTAESRLAEFRALVVDDPDHPLFEVLDRDALRDAIDNYANLSHQLKQQVFGAFTAGLWIGHHEEELYPTSAPSTVDR